MDLDDNKRDIRAALDNLDLDKLDHAVSQREAYLVDQLNNVLEIRALAAEYTGRHADAERFRSRKRDP